MSGFVTPDPDLGIETPKQAEARFKAEFRAASGLAPTVNDGLSMADDGAPKPIAEMSPEEARAAVAPLREQYNAAKQQAEIEEHVEYALGVASGEADLPEGWEESTTEEYLGALFSVLPQDRVEEVISSYLEGFEQEDRAEILETIITEAEAYARAVHQDAIDTTRAQLTEAEKKASAEAYRALVRHIGGEPSEEWLKQRAEDAAVLGVDLSALSAHDQAQALLLAEGAIQDLKEQEAVADFKRRFWASSPGSGGASIYDGLEEAGVPVKPPRTETPITLDLDRAVQQARALKPVTAKDVQRAFSKAFNSDPQSRMSRERERLLLEHAESAVKKAKRAT